MTIVLAVAIVFLALLLRLVPNWLAKGVLGVDHWYWKAYIEAYRRERAFPPRLPQYLLDQHHWYPPLFPLLVGISPGSILGRLGQSISVILDLLRLALVLAAAAWVSAGDPRAVAVAGLVYASTPILISYNTQLNPRGLAALMLDGVLLLVLWGMEPGGAMAIWIWTLAILLSGLLLLTHKMTTQLFWFLCLSLGVLRQDWRLLALIPVSIGAALLLSRGFYWNVMKGHWDIVSFWYRNWRWLQAHPLKESPIYGEPGFETPTKFHRGGLSGVMRHIRYLAGFNPGAWLLVALVVLQQSTGAGGVQDSTFSWVVLCLTFVLATVFVPFMKCLGSGYFYLYNAASPVALLAALFVHASQLSYSSVGILLAGNALAVAFYYWSILHQKRPSGEDGLSLAMEYLKTAPKGTIFCLPLQGSDIVAYYTGQPVLTGGHGYGFKVFEPLFPRLLIPIQDVVRKFEVRYLLTREGYLTETFLKDLQYKEDRQFEQHHVYIL